VAVRTTRRVVDDPGTIGPLGPPYVVPAPGDQAETARALADLRAAGLLASGAGGLGGHGDPGDHGGGGGGDGWEPEEEWGPRQYSRAVRALALLAVIVLVVGTAGAWLSIALDGVSAALPVSAVVEGAAPPGAATGPGTAWQVLLRVANESGGAADASCLVAAASGGRQGWVVTRIGHLRPGATAERLVAVTVPGSRPDGTLPAVAAACGAR
jgi:hypothetical protein